ncbi:EamA family transporter [Marinoscillum furvescens]|uniref:Transporter family protein n=1 Tax=Marinoscillum furvescens DSM 4134 TaxID=1122208 RepID=A0A3D9L7W6_MARFU|nr:EamA family transporter [Marinoscillum furvescens]REE01749.1 transporter family protein [Marinoscillum furvescens DSM 4134]
MWLLLAIASAFFLGFYDIFKKLALDRNAVLPILFLSTVAGSIIMLGFVLSSRTGLIPADHLAFVPTLTAQEHWLLVLKTLIVLSSWICTYFALKHLPLTIFAPIRSTGPLWTTLGAFVIFAERLTPMQFAGGALIFIFFYLFSTAGKLEGFSFRTNKYVWLMITGTLLGSVSALYDRYLLREINVMAVEAYFTFYQTLLLIPVLAIFWYPNRAKSTPFSWRWSIPFIGLFLLIGDYLYFYSISLPDSLISIIALVRRSNVVIVFIFGALIFKEHNIRKKGFYLIGILVGLVLLVLGR